MAFNSFFDQLPFNGSFDNGMPVFPFGGAYPGPSQGQAAASLPSPASAAAAAPQGQQPQQTSAPFSPGNVSGFSSNSYNPQIGTGGAGSYGDAPFALMGFNPPSMPSMGFNPQNFGIAPAQSSSFDGFGNIGIGDRASGIWDRISSIGNSPTIRNDNLTQAGINAAGLAFPLVGPLAGILQGFNLIDGGLPTGNAWADVAFTPGASQSVTADIANWINRQFGGEYMPYDLGRHTVQDSPGLQYQLGQLANPYDPMSNFAGFTEMPAQSDHSSGAAADFSNQIFLPPTDPYSMTGNMMDTFMLGATFGGGRWDMGGGGGFGSNFGQPSGSADYNGGWGQ